MIITFIIRLRYQLIFCVGRIWIQVPCLRTSTLIVLNSYITIFSTPNTLPSPPQTAHIGLTDPQTLIVPTDPLCPHRPSHHRPTSPITHLPLFVDLTHLAAIDPRRSDPGPNPQAAATVHLSFLFAVIGFFCVFIWVWWLRWWWLILANVVVVDDFGSGFCGFWLWVSWFMVVVVAVSCCCGCDGWLSCWWLWWPVVMGVVMVAVALFFFPAL